MTCLHVLCLIQAMLPLIVIFSEAIPYSGLSEGGILSAFKGVEVIEGLGALDTGEKEAQIEALSRSGVSVVHPANGKAIPPGSPLVGLLTPHHPGGEVLIQKVMSGRTICNIGLEPSSKCGVSVAMCLYHILEVASLFRVEDHSLMSGR